MNLVKEAGFPPGVVNVVTGAAAVGAMLCSSPLVARVSFTAQTERAVMRSAAQNLVPVTLELGGKSPNIVFADADIERAVQGAVAGIFGATGQTCMAGSRLLVQQPVFEKVIGATPFIRWSAFFIWPEGLTDQRPTGRPVSPRP